MYCMQICFLCIAYQAILLITLKRGGLVCLFVCLMVFNANFNYISVISWRSVLLVVETGGPGENH